MTLQRFPNPLIRGLFAIIDPQTEERVSQEIYPQARAERFQRLAKRLGLIVDIRWVGAAH